MNLLEATSRSHQSPSSQFSAFLWIIRTTWQSTIFCIYVMNTTLYLQVCGVQLFNSCIFVFQGSASGLHCKSIGPSFMFSVIVLNISVVLKLQAFSISTGKNLDIGNLTLKLLWADYVPWKIVLRYNADFKYFCMNWFCT